MTLALRIEMILLALIIAGVVLHSIYKKKLCVQYSIAWFLMALLLIVIALFPGIVFWLCGILGIQTPANLIYLFGILVLLMIVFSQTKIISVQTEKIKFLTQTVSIEKYLSEDDKN